MASGPIPALGSSSLGRPIAHRPRPTRCSVSIQLDPVPSAAARWPDSVFSPELVFRPSPLHGGGVLPLALPRLEAQPHGFSHRRGGVRIERLLRLGGMAADAERSGLGSTCLSILPARHARPIVLRQCRTFGSGSRIFLP